MLCLLNKETEILKIEANSIQHLIKYSPSPHKGMVVSIETGETFEHIIIWTGSPLPLPGPGTVIPGIVYQNLVFGVSQCEQTRLLIGRR